MKWTDTKQKFSFTIVSIEWNSVHNQRIKFKLVNYHLLSNRFVYRQKITHKFSYKIFPKTNGSIFEHKIGLEIISLAIV